ncbi:MAG: trypsin-like peptidase domain-containing protein [Fuerstiella sp.]
MKLSFSKLVALQLSAFLLLSCQSSADEFRFDNLPEVVLLDFTASYCGPCQQMIPLLQDMEKLGYPIRKIDFAANPDISKRMRVEVIPTLIVMVEGKEVKRFVGLTAEKTLCDAMNVAARKLHVDRQQAGSAQVAGRERTPVNRMASPDPTLAQTNSGSSANDSGTRTGIAGFFDRFTAPKTPESMDDIDVRAQSPEESSTSAEQKSVPHRATVRVRLMDGKMRDVGTGTVIHSVAGQSLVLTCAHIFKDAAADAIVEVDIFQGDKVLKYPATVLGGDHNADVALIQIKNSNRLPAAEVAFDRAPLVPRESLFSIGCSNGDPPTRLKMNVVEVNRFEGPSTVLCTNAPTQGRSGGGLFDADNRLVGVCSAADYKAGEGLYCGIAAHDGVAPLQQLMTKLNLTSMMQSNADNFAGEMAETIRPAEPESPFPTDDGVFDALFGDSSRSGASTSAAEALSQTVAATNPMQTGLTDPFAPARKAGRSAGTEITVIIKDPMAPNGEKVVVIPKASPWLLKLLTGEQSSGATAAANMTSPTSQRRVVEQPRSQSSAPFFQ